MRVAPYSSVSRVGVIFALAGVVGAKHNGSFCVVRDIVGHFAVGIKLSHIHRDEVYPFPACNDLVHIHFSVGDGIFIFHRCAGDEVVCTIDNGTGDDQDKWDVCHKNQKYRCSAEQHCKQDDPCLFGIVL